jgi:methionine-rich copper-binding protein CopC
MRRASVSALTALAVLTAATLLIPAGRAFAHAAYDHSTPAKDEVVPAPPAQIDAYFKQDIFRQAGTYYLRVFSDDNTTQVSEGDGTIDDNDRRHMFVALPAGLANGRYIVHWATLSDEDGEEDSGMYCFYIGVEPTPAQQAECASFEPTPVPTIGAATQATSAATANPTATLAPGDTNDDDGDSNTGVIIGVVIAIVAVVVVGGGAALWFRSRQA